MHRIELLKTHTHANEVHRPGSVIEVDEITARWLIEKGVGKASAPAQENAVSATADVPAPKHQRKAKE